MVICEIAVFHEIIFAGCGQSRWDTNERIFKVQETQARMEEVLVCAKGQCVVLVQSKFGELKPPSIPQVNEMDRENKLR